MAELGWEGRRMEGNVLFNDTLNTFYLLLYGVRHMVKGIGVGSHNSKQKHFEIHIAKKSN